MFHVCEVCNMFGYVVIGIIAAVILIFIVWLVKAVFIPSFKLKNYMKIVYDVDAIAVASIHKYVSHNQKWERLIDVYRNYDYYFRYILFYMVSLPAADARFGNYISGHPDFHDKLISEFTQKFNGTLSYGYMPDGYNRNLSVIIAESLVIKQDVTNLLSANGSVDSPRMELPDALLSEFIKLCNFDPNEAAELLPLWKDTLTNISALYKIDL